MSPKSRGRPKGRGRPVKKGQQQKLSSHPALQAPPPSSLLDIVLRSVRSLDETASALWAQEVASNWLGLAWGEAGIGQRQPERDLVEAVVGELGRAREHTAYRALWALDTVAGPEEHELIAPHLATVTEEAPPWAGRATVVPTQAWRSSDAWGQVIDLAVAFDEPEPHVLGVSLSTIGGRMVHLTTVLDPPALQGWLEQEERPFHEAPVEDVLGEVADALWQTDLYWPRQASPDYTGLRALAHARTRDFRTTREHQSISEEDRKALVDDFTTQADTDLPDDVVRLLADTFVDFGDGYLDGGVLAWGPGEVDRFMLDWVPRKVILDAENHRALPRVLRAWLPFVLRRRGLAEEHIAPVVNEVTAAEEDYLESYDDESSWGLGRQVVSSLLAQGVDLSDKDSVEQGMRAYNAQQLALGLRDSSGER